MDIPPKIKKIQIDKVECECALEEKLELQDYILEEILTGDLEEYTKDYILPKKK